MSMNDVEQACLYIWWFSLILLSLPVSYLTFAPVMAILLASTPVVVKIVEQKRKKLGYWYKRFVCVF